MKTHPLIAPLLLATLIPLHAEILQIDLAPTGTSAAIGLSPANEVPVATGTGSGGEILSGITYDTDTNLLSVALGYGSFAGFTNLTGVATAAHIHGPAAVTATPPPIFDFFTAGQHLPAPVATNGGVIIGSTTLSEANETNLRNGQLYINVHTAANANGEIRAQLIPVVGQPTVTCPEDSEVECTSHNDTDVELVANVTDPDGDALSVVWTIDGVAKPSINVPSGGATTSAQVSFDAELDLGEHTVSVAVTDGNSVAVSCESTITVVDTVAPEITKLKATPNSLWPPNGKMKTVNLDIKAKDACGDVTTKILSVVSSDGGTSDFQIVDENTVKLVAKRSGQSERVYTITVEATDESGNTATKTVEVKVPHDRGHGGRGNGHGNNDD